MAELLSGLENHTVIKIASNANGQHFLALTSDGRVYSWGDGQAGQLGYSDFRSVFMIVTYCQFVYYECNKLAELLCSPMSHVAVTVSSQNINLPLCLQFDIVAVEFVSIPTSLMVLISLPSVASRASSVYLVLCTWTDFICCLVEQKDDLMVILFN